MMVHVRDQIASFICRWLAGRRCLAQGGLKEQFELTGAKCERKLISVLAGFAPNVVWYGVLPTERIFIYIDASGWCPVKGSFGSLRVSVCAVRTVIDG